VPDGHASSIAGTVRRDLTALLLRRAAAGAQAMPASGQLRLVRFLQQMLSLAGRRPDSESDTADIRPDPQARQDRHQLAALAEQTGKTGPR